MKKLIFNKTQKKFLPFERHVIRTRETIEDLVAFELTKISFLTDPTTTCHQNCYDNNARDQFLMTFKTN